MGKLYQPVNLPGHLRKEVKLPFGHTLIRRRFNQIKWLKKNNYKKEIPLDRRTGNRWPYAATSIWGVFCCSSNIHWQRYPKIDGFEVTSFVYEPFFLKCSLIHA